MDSDLKTPVSNIFFINAKFYVHPFIGDVRATGIRSAFSKMTWDLNIYKDKIKTDACRAK